jgi:glucose/arabinose dehydrogenase
MRVRTLAILAVLKLLTLGTTAAAVTPAGFVDELVAAVPAPTALAFTPDTRMLITTQLGQLRVVQGGTLLAAPALDLSSILCTNIERGLLGVAVDRAFSTNGFIYLYYTFNRFGSCAQNSTARPVSRVSRFTLTSSNTVSRAS